MNLLLHQADKICVTEKWQLISHFLSIVKKKTQPITNKLHQTKLFGTIEQE